MFLLAGRPDNHEVVQCVHKFVPFFQLGILCILGLSGLPANNNLDEVDPLSSILMAVIKRKSPSY